MINSLDKIYNNLKRYSEIKNYKLLMYNNKLELVFSDIYKIECNKSQIIIYKNNKIIKKEKKKYDEMYMYLLNLIKTNKFCMPKSSKNQEILNNVILIFSIVMMTNALKLELKKSIIFCILYVLSFLLIVIILKGIVVLFYAYKSKKINKNDIKLIKKYIKTPLPKSIYKLNLELEFYNMKEICRSLLKYQEKININLIYTIDNNYVNKILANANDEQFSEFKKLYILHSKMSNIISKYYDEHGTKKDI